jgi:hypothetical protein
MLSAQCPAALNQRQTVAIGPTREKSRIEFPIVYRLTDDKRKTPMHLEVEVFPIVRGLGAHTRLLRNA